MVFSLQKTPIWGAPLFFLALRGPPPSPRPLSFERLITHGDELAAQLPAACLTQEHQQPAGLALRSPSSPGNPAASGRGWGVRVGRNYCRGVQGAGSRRGAHRERRLGGPASWSCAPLTPVAVPVTAPLALPSLAAPSLPLLAPSLPLSPDRGCSGPLHLPPQRPRAPLAPRPRSTSPRPWIGGGDLRGRRFWPARAPHPCRPQRCSEPARVARRWLARTRGAEGIPGTRSTARER